MRAIEPPDDYWSGDDQLTPTVGPHMGALEAVEDADDETVRAVLEAIRSPTKVPEAPENDVGVRVKADGSTGELPMLPIPGFGEAYGPDHDGGACGKPMPMACLGCGHTAEIGRTCRRSTCPRCGAAWVRDRAVNICARLGAVRAVRDSNRDPHQRYHHWVAIPPESWRLEHDDPLDRTQRVIGDLIDAFDHEGYSFPHPWSGSGYDDDEEQLEDDRGKWKDRLFEGRDWQGDVRKELKFRPHFHVVSVGNTLPGGDFTRELYNETGWILKRITKGEDSAVSLYDDEDLAKAVTYCLSHTAIDPDAGADGSAQTTYRRYGSLMHSSEINVDDETRDHHDRLVRRAASTTLGIPLADQFCLAETVGDTSDGDDRFDARSRVIAQAAADSDHGDDCGCGPESPDAEVEASTKPDAPSPVDASEPLSTPADRDGDLSLDLEEPADECEGRMAHLCEARHLLDDEDWVDAAPHADELQTTLDEWADRLDELIRWGPFNSG